MQLQTLLESSESWDPGSTHEIRIQEMQAAMPMLITMVATEIQVKAATAMLVKEDKVLEVIAVKEDRVPEAVAEQEVHIPDLTQEDQVVSLYLHLIHLLIHLHSIPCILCPLRLPKHFE